MASTRRRLCLPAFALALLAAVACNGSSRPSDEPAFVAIGPEPFGINDAFLGASELLPLDEAEVFLQRRCGLLRDLGASWARGPSPFGIVWPVIEPTPGDRDFTRADLGLAAAASCGVTWQAGIDPYPKWEQTGTGTPIPYSNPEPFADYLDALLERYDGDGVGDMPGLTAPLRHFEIGNEVMLVPEFAADVERYLSFLELSHRLIRKQVPGAVVLLGGTAGGGDDYEARSRPYVESLLRRGAGEYFDVLSFHVYSYEDGALAAQADGYRDLLRAYGYHKPLWLTETGISSRPTGPEPWRQGTMAVQARWVVKATVSALARGVEKVIWHSLADTDPAAPFGLVTHDGIPKPSYYTYRLMTAQLGSMRLIRELPISEGARVFELRGDGDVVIVGWSRGAGEVTLDLSRWTTATDLTVVRAIVDPGRTEPPASTMRAAALVVDETPVFARPSP